MSSYWYYEINNKNRKAKCGDKKTYIVDMAERDSFEMVDYLLKKEAYKVDMRNYFGDTALIWGAINGNTKIVELLLSYDANMFIENDNGMSALDYACFFGHLNTVEILLNRLKTHEITYDLKSVIYACDHSFFIKEKEFMADTETDYDRNFDNKNEIIRLVLESDLFNVNSTNTAGDTALTVAAKQRNVKLVRLLLRRGADKNIKNLERQYPYDYLKLDELKPATQSVWIRFRNFLIRFFCIKI